MSVRDCKYCADSNLLHALPASQALCFMTYVPTVALWWGQGVAEFYNCFVSIPVTTYPVLGQKLAIRACHHLSVCPCGLLL